MQLRDDRGRFRRLGRVVLIGLGRADQAEWFCSDRRLDGFICLADPDQRGHRDFGLGRGSLRQVLGPQLYGRWRQASALPEVHTRPTREDMLQMPGTFVIDTAGVVRFAHRNRDAADNPPNEALLDVLAGLSRRLPA